MEWDAPAIILDVRPFGEADAIATLLTAEHGAYRGLARGGASRARAATWQAGNLVQARWVARLADQLGSVSAELVHPAAALAMEDGLALAVLSSCCAVAEGALPEREPHPRAFEGLLRLIARVADANGLLADAARWELGLLADLGYGLDLSACAVTGATEGLAFVSPRTGRAVSAAAAGVWRDRLLRLPAFLGAGGAAAGAPGGAASAGDAADALALTGRFLERDVFGSRHRPLPAARRMLGDRAAAMAGGGRP